ncbi:hypothetical protein TNCV_347181 [Trichonephila clavipes]|nr:hypothetical protein TNCV_347181 [Trichonephila clavipes]
MLVASGLKPTNVAFPECSLLVPSIAACIDRDLTIVMRMWMGWVQEGHTERLSGYQWYPASNARENRQSIEMGSSSDVLNDKTGYKSSATISFQTTSVSTCRIMIVESVSNGS